MSGPIPPPGHDSPYPGAMRLTLPMMAAAALLLAGIIVALVVA